ncbi:endoglycoceramidase [Zopfochytrium polystomum]|nr:endoglycoceramidase [Zopfochytrium polystomum]
MRGLSNLLAVTLTLGCSALLPAAVTAAPTPGGSSSAPAPPSPPPPPPAPATLPASATALPKITGFDGAHFIDERGRARVLRGTNVVVKGFPWHPDTSPGADPSISFNKDDVNLLAKLGTTAIRLGVMWPGLEPVRGQYNTTYLDVMRGIVEIDVLSEKFCGEGVPLWAAQPDGSVFDALAFPVPVQLAKYDLDSNGVPTGSQCGQHNWADYQFAYATGSAYENLYKNHDGLLDAFIGYWKAVATTFKGYTNILGYEIMNEPWAGNVVTNPLLLVPGTADLVNLQPFHDAVAAAIRPIDPTTLIMYESVTWDNFYVGFSHPPNSDPKTVLSFHYYNPGPNIISLTDTINDRINDARRLGSGVIMSEFDMGWGDGANVGKIRDTAAATENYFLSYMGWTYVEYLNPWNPMAGLRNLNGTVRVPMAQVWSRPYATAIPGAPQSMSYNDTAAVFKLSFTADGSQEVCEIRFCASCQYGASGAYSVTATATGTGGGAAAATALHVQKASVGAAGDLGAVYVYTDAVQKGARVDVTIAPA